MFHVEVEIFKTRSKIKSWMRYRDVTLLEEQRAIQSLERELAYMIDNYVVLSSTIVAFSAEQTVQKIIFYICRILGENNERRTVGNHSNGAR